MKVSKRVTWHCEGDERRVIAALQYLSKRDDVGFTINRGFGVYGGERHAMWRIEHVVPYGASYSAETIAKRVEDALCVAAYQKCVMPVIDVVNYACSCEWKE